MSDYRIKKVTHYRGSFYVLQKRLFGFLWWYNPDNIDGAITGIYDTREEAMEAYRSKIYRRRVEVSDVLEGSS